MSAFPPGFLWGAATSAYQIEGSPLADGAGMSSWHRFAHTPGRTARGETGDIACDHYRRWADDVELMAALGLRAYRFSLAWSRILPEGRGAVNPAGLDFYSRLIDRLLDRGIEPWVTLHHWDFPAALDDRGGWLNRDSMNWFADYARVAFRAFGDRVSNWMTINEPWVIVDAGYLEGVHAPGHRNLYEAPRAAHHLLLAHGAAVTACRAERPGALIGIVVNLEPREPATDSPADREAFARADAWMNRQFLDPLYRRRTPAELPPLFGEAWPAIAPGDFELIAEPTDFLGINYYQRGVIRDDPGHPPVRAQKVVAAGALRTAIGWEVHPEGLARTLQWVTAEYGRVPIYVTENGAAFPDPPAAPGELVDDPLRVDYLRRHLRAARMALENGVDLRGYFAWSLLDNYEWAAGYEIRFGLVRVDFATQERTLKRSAEFYRGVIGSNGADL